MKPLRKRRRFVSESSALLSLLIATAAVSQEVPSPSQEVAAPAQEVAAPVAEVTASSQEVAESDAAATSPDAVEATPTTVRFSFDRTPWRDVIRWIADEADLALHVGELPTGSFTYSDPNDFTFGEAIDRINLFLLPEGFTLVRSGNLLSVINLADSRSRQQLDALAELINVDELAGRPSYDVVKCIFPLGDIDGREAVQELSVLKLMTDPEVLSKTKQLLITDTVAKLRSVQKILDTFRAGQMDEGTVVKSFELKHVTAEDILTVARPHLGLAPEETLGIDISISSDMQGKNLFVTGLEEKVNLLEGLVQAIDQPRETIAKSEGPLVLRNHLVEGGNVETVYNVLLTLLAGKDVRLSMDRTSSSVVALASPEVQSEIEQTVMQLQGTEADFEVIPLKKADPYLVISLLEQMLDLPGPLDDPDEIDPDAPKIDADPANRRLFVRAKRPQIEQIKKMVAGLDESAPVEDERQLRIFPLKGRQAEKVLESAAKFWRGENPVVLYRSLPQFDSGATERVLTGESSDDERASEARALDSDSSVREFESPARVLQSPSIDAQSPVVPTKHPADEDDSQRWLTSKVKRSAAPIRCQLTPRGLLMQSEDGSALESFENHLRLIAGPTDALPSPPIVFYLKYTKAPDAIRMLSELLEGGEAAAEVSQSTLVNGYVSSSSSFFGNYISSQDGTLTLTAGNVTVVADSRLNRLIVQGTVEEVEQIEGYLRIIDKDNSITSVETYGTSHVIELVNTQASDVAEALREAFAGRVVASESNASNQPQRSGDGAPPQRPSDDGRRDSRDDDRDGANRNNGGRGGAPVRDLEPKMTIAVHEPSNSLIVTAPQQLYEEVEKLARSIDSRAEETVEVLTPVNGEVFEAVLQQFLGQEPTSRRSSSSSSRSSSSQSYRSSSSSSRSSSGR